MSARAVLDDVLQRVFGWSHFRPIQGDAAASFLEGQDGLVVLPTGGGKSLCYQAPAVALFERGQGVTLVVSPLVALMDDQVAALRKLGVSAAALHSNIAFSEQKKTLSSLSQHALVYMSPERLGNARIQKLLTNSQIARVAVDEAHCISEWGHDFRPEYRALSWLKRSLKVPVFALTATATPDVREDIVASLALVAPRRFVGSFARENLRFCVEHQGVTQTRTAWAVDKLVSAGFAVRRPEGRALVYAVTRKRANEVQRALRKAKIRAVHYHAGRSESARDKAHKAFASGASPVLVATSAFGMGIDLPDVRLVLHVEAPATLEAYYQQAGRAGRDGQPAECALAFSPADERIHALLAGQRVERAAEHFRSVERYAWASACREQLLLAHFGETKEARCGRCDVCREPTRVSEMLVSVRERAARTRQEKRERARTEAEVTLAPDELAAIVACVDGLRKPVGRRLIVKALRGSQARDVKRKGLIKNPQFSALREAPEIAVFAGIDALLAQGTLVRKGKKYPTVWIADKPVRPRAAGKAQREPPTGVEQALRMLRKREAKRRRIKPYQIFADRTLFELVEKRPTTRANLLEVWGLGEERVNKYGGALLELLAQWSPNEISRSAE